MTPSSVRRRDPLLAVVLLLAVCGAALALQGWRSRIPTVDLIPHFLDAAALVREGVIPNRGTISGYLAYNPPGTTWLMVPGVIVTHDPRLIEFVASSLLYAATLLGIYALARSAFGRPTALFATALYAFSEIGLFVAGSLWPRAPIQPFFVWMVYWLLRWAIMRQAQALAIALGIWATGMYVFMEIAPAILLVPFFWYRYRPPVRLAPLAIAAVAALAVWWPYLAYEGQRDYRDLQSMVRRAQVIESGADGRQPWCDPRLTVLTADGRVVAPAAQSGQNDAPSAGGLRVVAGAGLLRFLGAVDNVVTGPTGGTLPIAPISHLVLFTAAALSLIAVAVGSTAAGRFAVARAVRGSRVSMVLGTVFLGLGIVIPEVLVAFFSPDGSIEQGTRDALTALRILLLAVGVCLMIVAPASRALSRLTALLGAYSPGAAAREFLLFALVVPWVTLAVLAEPGRSDRFWWLWPLLVIFVAALVCHAAAAPTWRQRVQAAVLGAVVAGFTWVTPVSDRLQSWRENGWASVDADEIRALEYIASRVGDHRQVRIGYHRPLFVGIPSLSAIDPRFKGGAELDLVLLYTHEIVNGSRCAEGFGPEDDYRIAVDASKRQPVESYRIVASPGPEFRPVRRFGDVVVFSRNQNEPP